MNTAEQAAPEEQAAGVAQMVAAPPTEEELEAEERREQARVAALDMIGSTLEKMKDEAVSWRAEYEMEWAENYHQYSQTSRGALADAKDSRGAATNAGSEEQYRSTNDNITRPKVIVSAARLGDMLFPTSDSNWGLEASPRPDVPEEMLGEPPPGPPGEDGQPTPGAWTPETLEVAKREFAAKAAAAMFNTIDDQFEESGYDEHGRAAIFDACLYGTGVLRGPTLRTRQKHAWGAAGRGGELMPMVRQSRPSVEHVDLWAFFPQPSRSMEECEHVFQLHVMPPAAVRRLVRQPGFDRKQIARLLEMEPAHGALAEAAITRGALRPDAHVVLSKKYTVWEYRGPMPKEAFAHFMAGLAAQQLISDDDAAEFALALESDPLNEIDCEVWMSQGVVLKMALSILEPGTTGYYTYNYEANPNSLFGHGVPYLCRDDQKATNQLWHAIMLNSMMSAGPQIGVRTGCLIPTGEGGSAGRGMNLSATKPRTWALNEEVTNINEALSVFIIPNVTQQIMAVYERSKANADEHTMMPMIAQGEATSAVPTSSGMAMLMNAANVVTRKQAKCWDDQITSPLVTAFYCWNMQFNDDPSIKGDYTVIPKGSSHLLIKDIQAQHVQFATTMFSNNPMLQPYMKASAFAKKNIEMLDLSVSEMLNTDDEVQRQQQAQAEQENPEVLKAKATQAQAEAAQMRATTENEIQNRRIEFDKWERGLQHTERMADIEARREIQQAQLEGQRLAIAHKLADMEASERIAMQQIIADLKKHEGDLDLGKYKIDAKVAVDAERIAQSDDKLRTELTAEIPNVKIA